jgi:uncharacterized protein YeaO (DUF488 family)
LEELGHQSEALAAIDNALRKFPSITFVYAAKDTQQNNAVVLLEYIDRQGKTGVGNP